MTADRRATLSKSPHGDGCQECRETAVAGHAPQKKPWEEFAKELEDARKHAAFQSWRARRQGKPSLMAKQAVQHVTRVGVRWEDSFVPVSVAELTAQYPDTPLQTVPGLRIETLRNSSGEPCQMVLTHDPKIPPRVIMYCQTEAELHELVMRPETHLRSGQGQEYWAELLKKTLQARPSTTGPTQADLADMMQNGATRRRPAPASPVFACPAAATANMGATTEAGATGAAEPMIVSVCEEELDADSGISAPRSGGSADSRAATKEILADVSDGTAGRQRRRLRQTNSDGTAPCKRTRGQKKLAAAVATDTPENEVPLTVVNLLKGLVPKPKVSLYHRRQQLPKLNRTGSSLDILTEERELTALTEAERLQPTELLTMPDEELHRSLKIVLNHLGKTPLPCETMQALVRRRAQLTLKPMTAVPAAPALADSQRVAGELFTICWPWASKSTAFDPFEPTFTLTPEWQHMPPSDHASVVGGVIIKDVLATFVHQSEHGAAGLVEFARLAKTTALPANLADEHRQMVHDLHHAMGGLTAMVQTTPVSGEQLQGVLTLRDAQSFAAMQLAPLLRMPWWSSRTNLT